MVHLNEQHKNLEKKTTTVYVTAVKDACALAVQRKMFDIHIESIPVPMDLDADEIYVTDTIVDTQTKNYELAWSQHEEGSG